MRCFWCDTDPDEITGRPEGPHSIYCLGFRVKLYPPGVTTDVVNGRVVYRFPEPSMETRSIDGLLEPTLTRLTK